MKIANFVMVRIGRLFKSSSTVIKIKLVHVAYSFGFVHSGKFNRLYGLFSNRLRSINKSCPLKMILQLFIVYAQWDGIKWFYP